MSTADKIASIGQIQNLEGATALVTGRNKTLLKKV